MPFRMPMITRKPTALAHFAAALLATMSLGALAETIPLPPDGGDVVGQIKYATARHEDTLIDIARRYSVGQDEIIMANPKVDRWLPKEGTKVVIPRRMILPDAPRAGVVVNIPEMRLYYYPVKYAPAKTAKAAPVKTAAKPAKPLKPGEKAPPPPPKPKPQPVAEVGEPISQAGEVITYPISIGRMDWRTPLGKTRVVAKVKDPVWRPPESIKREHAKDGEILPDVVPAGPDNPLGQYALRLGVSGYLIHGVDRAKSDGIGMRVTHGCVRMYPEDIEKLFPKVAVGTPVYLVNQPIKLGWDHGSLYMEVHRPLDDDDLTSSQLYNMALDLIAKKTADQPVAVNKDIVRKATATPSGLPVEIGRPGSPPPLQAEPADRSPAPATAARRSAPPPRNDDDSEDYAPPPHSSGAHEDSAPRDRGDGEAYAPPPPPRRPPPARSAPVDPYAAESADDAPPPARKPSGAATYPYGASPPPNQPLYPRDSYGTDPGYARPRPAASKPRYDVEETDDASSDSAGTSYSPPRPRPAPKPAVDPYEPASESADGDTSYAPYDSER